MLTSDFFDALDHIILVSSTHDFGEENHNAAARALAAACSDYINEATCSILREQDRHVAGEKLAVA